jgi:hypothetical protein
MLFTLRTWHQQNPTSFANGHTRVCRRHGAHSWCHCCRGTVYSMQVTMMITFITFGPQTLRMCFEASAAQACHHERNCLHQCHPSLQTWPLDCVHLGTPVLSMSFIRQLSRKTAVARARFDLVHRVPGRVRPHGSTQHSEASSSGGTDELSISVQRSCNVDRMHWCADVVGRARCMLHNLATRLRCSGCTRGQDTLTSVNVWVCC